MHSLFKIVLSLLVFTPLGVFTIPLARNACAGERPNIVFILADDYGYGSANCLGASSDLIQTPAIDRLAREGRRFTDAYTTSSVCSPTRYASITGRYCWRTSLKHQVLNTFAPLHIETHRLTLASLLKQHGYSTAAVGKWHLGYGQTDGSPNWRTDYGQELSPGPLDIGFDYHFGVPSNHGDLTGVFVENRFVFGMKGQGSNNTRQPGYSPLDADDVQTTYEAQDTEGGRGAGRILDLDAPRRKNDRVMKVLTDKAIAWVKDQPKDRPFFLYFTPVAVHNPVTPSNTLAGKSAVGIYGDWIHELDQSVDRILKTLDDLKLTENTLIIFSSDNGGVFKPANEQLLQTAAYRAGLKVNGPLRGGKHDIWEGGFKVPFLVRWPNRIAPNSVSNEAISLVDLVATTSDLLGTPLPKSMDAAEDSVSFLHAMFGKPTDTKRDHVIVHSAAGVFAIRKGPWKWIEGVPVDEIKPAERRNLADQFQPQLFNLATDPAESRDVSSEHPEVVKELSELLRRYRLGGYSRVMPPIVEPPKPKVVELPPAAGTTLLENSLSTIPSTPWQASHGEWAAQENGLFGTQKGPENQGASLRVPVEFQDGTIEYQVRFHGANRTSLRIECKDRQGSFRIELSKRHVGITKNPSPGEGRDKTEPIARQTLELPSDQWVPVRLQFHGNDLKVQVNDTLLTGSHPVLGMPKSALNFLVFGESAGFRNVRVAK